MLDPYKMVFISLLSSITLAVGCLVYRYFYPKKKINLFTALALISILPLISLLRPGDYESGDFNIHIYRIMAFFDSLKEGHLMPSWAGELNATYGNPLFIFNYSLPYYFISLLHFIGISFIDSTKIYLGLTLYLSGIFMYLWIKELTANKLAAFTSAIFYVFSPYHLIDVHFRATLGESTIFLLLPLLFLFITKYNKKNNFIYLVCIALFTDLLLMAHPLVASVFFGVTILYILLMYKINKHLKSTLFQLSSLFVGLIASIYVWIPFILYSPYMFKAHPDVSNYIVPLDFFKHLFYSPWRYGLLFQGHYGELAHVIGYTQIFVLVASIIMIVRKKIPKKTYTSYLFWICLCLITLIIMTPLSNTMWKYLSSINPMLLIYGRLSLAISFFTSIIAGYFVLLFANKKRGRLFIYILIIITVGYTILNWGHRRVIPEIDDNALKQRVWISTITEGTTAHFLNNKWADPKNFWFSAIPQKHLEILQGKAEIKELERTSTQHLYILNAKTPVVIKENTLFFPKWSLSSNGKNFEIYPGKRGVVNAKLPEGLQYIVFSYNDLLSYTVAKIVSLGIFLSFIFILFINWGIRFFSRNPQKFPR